VTTLQGFLFPQSATGRSSMLPSPPWHYAGDLLSIRYRTDPAGLRQFLPDGLDLADGSGTATLVFADWQSCSDSGEELLDPVTAQYKECYIDLAVAYRGEVYGRVVLIWVDKDFALVRGHYQGYPKRFGSVAMTRPFPVGKAGPRLEPGGTFGATLAASDRRLVEARFTITGQQTDGARAPQPVQRLHSRRLPSLDPGAPATLDELVAFTRTDFERGPVFTGDATVTFFPSPSEELDLIAPHEVLGGTYATVASTWTGGHTVR
jgi:acetoacetate decarboxylase